jgi:hypothetical protein
MARRLLMASRKAVVGLILAATILFVVGILLENGTEESHSDSVAFAAETEAEQAAESGEESGEEAGESGESDEKVLGIDLESTPFVVLAVLGSLLLAAMVWFGRAPWILLVVAAAMLTFAIFDVAEIFHQIDRSEGGIAALAAVVAALHLASGYFAAQLRGATAP